MIIKYLYNDFFRLNRKLKSNELVMSALKVECKIVI